MLMCYNVVYILQEEFKDYSPTVFTDKIVYDTFNESGTIRADVDLMPL